MHLIAAAQMLPWHPGAGSSAGTFGAVGLAICLPALATVVLVLLGAWSRSSLARRRARNAPAQAARDLEASLRATMSELCPHGWRAQVTLFGHDDHLPEDAPHDDRCQVALDWAELGETDRLVAVERRVWGATVTDALEAMVIDRRTDLTLEQIEQAARWPDQLA